MARFDSPLSLSLSLSFFLSWYMIKLGDISYGNNRDEEILITDREKNCDNVSDVSLIISRQKSGQHVTRLKDNFVKSPKNFKKFFKYFVTYVLKLSENMYINDINDIVQIFS